MGLDYSYELIALRGRTKQLVSALLTHLVPKDHDRLLAALGSGDEKLLQTVQRDDLESMLFEKGYDSLCLAFLFPSDDHLKEYGGIEEFADIEGNRVAVGCVWGSLEVGNNYIRFTATAATSSMSRLFEKSPSIRKTLTQIAKDAAADLLIFDDESDGNVLAVWPSEQQIKRPRGIGMSAENTQSLAELVRQMEKLPVESEKSKLDIKIDIDRYCAEQLAMAGTRTA